MDHQSTLKIKPNLSSTIQLWVSPVMTAMLGLIAGVLTSSYNSDLAANKFFLEKQVATADSVAIEFSRYVENWSRLIRLRKEFDAKNKEPSAEEKEYFKKTVSERAIARVKLFASLDSAYLYYGKDTSNLVIKFRDWDSKQSDLTIEKLPDINEWRRWQIDILRQLHKEIRK
ncbi:MULTISPECIES: hypothetical protein [Nitrosospira]|nr:MULTISPECIES: hypothetical protein [Nitrosospira]